MAATTMQRRKIARVAVGSGVQDVQLVLVTNHVPPPWPVRSSDRPTSRSCSVQPQLEVIFALAMCSKRGPNLFEALANVGFLLAETPRGFSPCSRI